MARGTGVSDDRSTRREERWAKKTHAIIIIEMSSFLQPGIIRQQHIISSVMYLRVADNEEGRSKMARAEGGGDRSAAERKEISPRRRTPPRPLQECSRSSLARTYMHILGIIIPPVPFIIPIIDMAPQVHPASPQPQSAVPIPDIDIEEHEQGMLLSVMSEVGGESSGRRGSEERERGRRGGGNRLAFIPPPPPASPFLHPPDPRPARSRRHGQTRRPGGS